MHLAKKFDGFYRIVRGFFQVVWQKILEKTNNNHWLILAIVASSTVGIYFSICSFLSSDEAVRASSDYSLGVVQALRFDLSNNNISGGYNNLSLNHAWQSYLMATGRPVTSSTISEVATIDDYWKKTSSSTQEINGLVSQLKYNEDYWGRLSKVFTFFFVLSQAFNTFFTIKLMLLDQKSKEE